MNATTQSRQSLGAPPTAKGVFTAFGARHIRGVAITRWVVAAGLAIAAVVLAAFGQWWGALLLLPAGLNGALAYLVPHWNPRSDAPGNAQRPV